MFPRNFLTPEAAKSKPFNAPCVTEGKAEITISCDYRPLRRSKDDFRPRIALNRATIRFTPSDEGILTVHLTFTNQEAGPIADARPVYFLIDDDSGQNHVRRQLPNIDLRQLQPGKPIAFTNRFLSGAFSAGRYVIELWIPDADKLFEFDASHNLLLSSQDVPDRATGLNKLARFQVAATKMSR